MTPNTFLTIICLMASAAGYAQQPSNTADEGVVINGVRWATRNVDMPNTFAATPESYGKFYQWNRKKAWNATDKTVEGLDTSIPEGKEWEKANDPSPAGWRVPTIKELECLWDTEKVIQKWTRRNGVKGRTFTDKATGNSIFLSASGYRDANGDGTSVHWAGIAGFYWSSTPRENDGKKDGVQYLHFDDRRAGHSQGYGRNMFNVRCVAAITALQAQDNGSRKNLPIGEYSFRIEKNRLGRQYVYRKSQNGEKEEAHLPKGDYSLKYDGESIDFSINENGQLCDSAKWQRKNLVTFYYENGIAVKAKSVKMTTGAIYSELELKDSVQTAISYYPSGQVEEKEMLYFNQNEATVSIIYYENGKIKSESNGKEGFFKFYYKNGNLSRFEDSRNSVGTYYNEDGTVDSKWYKQENESCNESYYNNLIVNKVCETPDELAEYYYELGKLTYYSILNRKTGEKKTYNDKGKIIPNRDDVEIMIQDK